jgi:hypothetical protein
MKVNKQTIASKENRPLMNATAITWMLLSFWLLYSALMLWHFKELDNFKAAICGVIGQF